MDDVYLSYVPLTHVQEQIMHFDAVMFAFKIGYSSGDMKNLVKDIQMLKPTVFGSFPAFFNKIYEKLREKIDNQPQFLINIIDGAIQTKITKYMEQNDLTHIIYDTLVFQIMRNILGGKIRFMVSGGAPLSLEVRNTLAVVFKSPIFEAYGATETAGCLTCTS